MLFLDQLRQVSDLQLTSLLTSLLKATSREGLPVQSLTAKAARHPSSHAVCHSLCLRLQSLLHSVPRSSSRRPTSSLSLSSGLRSRHAKSQACTERGEDRRAEQSRNSIAAHPISHSACDCDSIRGDRRAQSPLAEGNACSSSSTSAVHTHADWLTL